MREKRLNTIITLRLTDDQAKELRDKAQKEECSVADILREALDERLAAV